MSVHSFNNSVIALIKISRSVIVITSKHKTQKTNVRSYSYNNIKYLENQVKFIILL